MREPIKDKIRLEHIHDAINNVLSFTNGKTLDQIENDKILYFAVVKNIGIIGEAAYHLTKAFCQEHPETEWQGIMRMRNVLVHDYYQINLQTVWAIIQYDLPILQEQINRYLIETDWTAWEANEQAIVETAVHKNLIQTASRMKKDGLTIKQISRYTRLSKEEIEDI